MSLLTERFIRYAGMETTADPASDSSPSSSCQLDFLKVLRSELAELGMADVHLDERGTLYAGTPGGTGVTVGLLAHVDTSPDAPGKGVVPILHRNWDGSPIALADGGVIDPAETEDMPRYVGGTIITSDGGTLLGADDKAGVAIIMEACRMLLEDPSIPRPPIRVAFTTDEEIGRGVDGFDTERFGADLAYTVDGGRVGQVDTATFNAWSAEWTVTGREVHPGSARGIMVNAVRIAAEIISGLCPEEMPENSSGLEGYDYPFSVSGTTSSARIGMLLRDFSSEGMEKRLLRMRALHQWVRARHPGAGIELEMKEQYRNPAEVLLADRRPAEFALRGTAAAGLQASEGSIRGGTDGSRLSFMGVPTVNLPTGGEFYHSRREWIAAEGLELSLDTLIETIRIWGAET
jgi:tripeptide aminopeptidase